MNREELFKVGCYYHENMYTEDYFRQTGRTGRMLVDAVKTARQGYPVLVLAKDDQMTKALAQRVLETFGKVDGLTVMNATSPQVRNKIDWDNLRVGVDYVNHRVFFDHEVLYFNDRFKRIFREASKYDPKIAIKGDAMYFVPDDVIPPAFQAMSRMDQLLAKIRQEFDCSEKAAINIFRSMFNLADGGYNDANVEKLYQKYGIPA
jgi:hypothetical protein